ncbi:uncharacterized protein LOC128228997 isoform X2 [Mya arenaria]|uniref:uncharacterized protein LOC128228997 isoform X2 n=1 Tax=Mya arenaria TaxID=6604 RepID=UPI0022DFA5E8|nr:uncharacterized protein LOC128228997 isoform X2 [Mya arenaria]
MSTPRGSGGRNTTNRGRGGGVNTTGGHGGGANTHGGRGVGVQSGGQQRKSPVDVRVKPAESTDKKKSEGLNLTNLYTFLKGRLEHYKLSSKAQCTSIMNVIEIMAEQKTERSAEERNVIYETWMKQIEQFAKDEKAKDCTLTLGEKTATLDQRAKKHEKILKLCATKIKFEREIYARMDSVQQELLKLQHILNPSYSCEKSEGETAQKSISDNSQGNKIEETIQDLKNEMSNHQQLYQRKCKDLCQTLEGILNSNKDPVKANGDQPKDPPQNVGPKGTERRGTTGKGNAPTDIAKPIEKPTETMEDVEKLVKNVQQQMEKRERDQQLYQRKCNDMCLTLEGILNSNKDPVKANGYQPKEPPQNVGPKGTEGRGTKHTTGKGNAPTDIAKPTEKPKETIEDVEKLIKNVQQQMEERERESKIFIELVEEIKKDISEMHDYFWPRLSTPTSNSDTNALAKSKKENKNVESDTESSTNENMTHVLKVVKEMTARLKGIPALVKNLKLECVRMCDDLKEPLPENIDIRPNEEEPVMFLEIKNKIDRARQAVAEILNGRAETELAISQLKEKNGQLDGDVKELTLRLSKYAGARLRDNNPNITDLSDPNRPTKLGEEFSKLYDDEWTDAFDEMSKNDKKLSDTQAISRLIEVFEETFRFCNESSDKQLASLQSLLLKPATFATKDSCKENEELSLQPVSSTLLHDLRKSTAEISAEDVLQAYIEQHSEPEEEQTPGKTPNPKRKTEDIAGHGDSMSCVDKYTHKCLQLSWLASVQTPPIYVDFTVEKKSKFDKNLFREYTATGNKIEYVVWPAVYLHQNGGLLVKGVAQGTL